MFTIGQVARRAGIRTSTLRYYERMGLLSLPARSSGQRRYDEAVFQQLTLIKLAQRAGFTIAQVRMLLHGFPENTPASTRWQALAAPKLAETQALIQQILERQSTLEHLLLCQCEDLEQCVSSSTISGTCVATS